MNLDKFLRKFSGFSEEYRFYNNEVVLRYDPKAHIYYLLKDGEFVPQDGVTNVVHIIDKSEALIPWACKMMAQKLLATLPGTVLPTGDKIVHTEYPEFERLVLEAKSAPRDKLEEAADVGHIAHAWIEQYIKTVLANNEERKYELLAKFPEDERARNCCVAALDWMQKHNVRWLETECKIYSRKHHYAGTMDGLCRVDSCDNSLCCPSQFKDRLTVADWKSSNYLYIEYLFQTAAYEGAYEEEHGVDVEDRWIIRLGKEDGEFDPWHVEADTFERDYNGFLTCLSLGHIVKNAKDRMKVRKDEIRDATKKIEAAQREAALKIKCAYADKYKAVRRPNCNKGNPCETCLAKYAERQELKPENLLKNPKNMSN